MDCCSALLKPTKNYQREEQNHCETECGTIIVLSWLFCFHNCCLNHNWKQNCSACLTSEHLVVFFLLLYVLITLWLLMWKLSLPYLFKLYLSTSCFARCIKHTCPSAEEQTTWAATIRDWMASVWTSFQS